MRVFGKDLFDTLFRFYTERQWGRPSSLLPASILRRLPVRASYDSNYFDHKFQGIPVNRYTKLIENMFAFSDV